jgi:hypothetical protein
MKFGIIFLFLFALTLVEFATSSPEADPEPVRVLENVRNRIQQARTNNQASKALPNIINGIRQIQANNKQIAWPKPNAGRNGGARNVINRIKIS